jgi:hypothetical protein
VGGFPESARSGSQQFICQMLTEAHCSSKSHDDYSMTMKTISREDIWLADPLGIQERVLWMILSSLLMPLTNSSGAAAWRMAGFVENRP